MVDGADEGVGERRAGVFDVRVGSVDGRRPRLLPVVAGFLEIADMMVQFNDMLRDQGANHAEYRRQMSKSWPARY